MATTIIDHPSDALVFTMMEQDTIESSNHRNQNDLSNLPVPLSYSSADSATEYASLFGEAIISKDTLYTTSNNNSNNNNNNAGTSSGLNSVIVMVDHRNASIDANDTSTERKNNGEDDNMNSITTSVSVDDPICPLLCSNNNDPDYYSSTCNNHNNDETKVDMTGSSTPTSPSSVRLVNRSKPMSSNVLPPLSDGSVSPRREPLQTVSSMEEQQQQQYNSETRSNEFLDVIGCPCFQQSGGSNHWEYHPTTTTTTAAISSASSSKQLVQQSQVEDGGLNTSLLGRTSGSGELFALPQIRSLSLFDENEKKDDDDEEEEEEFQLDEELMTGIIEETGAQYHITKIIVEGWIHKKGTGHDWLGSRGWKARWARLAIGYIDGYDNVEVPLLGISWYPTSTNNSTVIVLDSTVVLAVDLPNKDRPHRFEIRHAKRPVAQQQQQPQCKNDKLNHPSTTITTTTTTTTATNALPVTRTFAAASRKARDAWVYAMSQALLSYEKQKAALRKLQLQRHGGNNGSSVDTSSGNGSSPMKQRLLSQTHPQPPRMSLSPKKVHNYDEIWLNDRWPPTTTTHTNATTGRIGSRSRSPSPVSRQQQQQQHSRSAVAAAPGRSKSPMIQTSIIGQDGILNNHQSANNNNNNNSQQRMKPMTIHTRSTSA